MEQFGGDRLEDVQTPERQSLYPERTSDSFSEVIEDIKRLESGETPRQELTEFERQELFEFEEQFAGRFESLYRLKAKTSNLYTSYFETEEGRKTWSELAEEEMPSLHGDDLRRFLYEKRDVLASLDTNVRVELAFRSRSYADERLLQSLGENMNEDNEFSVEGVEIPERVSIVINPEEVEVKVSGLCELKAEIKTTLAEIDQSRDSTSAARKCLLDMYARRINEILARQYSSSFDIAEKARELGSESLSDSEQNILRDMSVNPNVDLDGHRTRIDKFIYGATSEYNDEGYREQISKELSDYANEIELESEYVETHKNELIESKGLDPEKTNARSVVAEDRKAWADRVLRSYDLLSEDPSTDPARQSFDGKWRYIVQDRKSMSVDRIKKVILDKKNPSAITHALPVALAHEIEGHVLQGANMEHIPFRLFQDIGGGRSSVFAEGGAMHNQNKVSKELFGFEQLPKPHYVRAMVERLRGGSYLDCVKTYYESSIKGLRRRFKEGELSREEFDKQSFSLLKKNISSAKRLFRAGSLSSDSRYLLSSKDTAYLEQRKVLKGLEDTGLFKLAYVSGINLENARELIRLGLLDIDKIKAPEFYSLKIWEEVKDQYKKE